MATLKKSVEEVLSSLGPALKVPGSETLIIFLGMGKQKRGTGWHGSWYVEPDMQKEQH